MTRMPGMPLRRFRVEAGNASPVTCETVTSTWPAAAMTLTWKARSMVGRMVLMLKMSSVPKTMASVVSAVRSLRPQR